MLANCGAITSDVVETVTTETETETLSLKPRPRPGSSRPRLGLETSHFPDGN